MTYELAHLSPVVNDLQREVGSLPVAVGQHGVEQNPEAARVPAHARRVAAAPLVVQRRRARDVGARGRGLVVAPRGQELRVVGFGPVLFAVQRVFQRGEPQPRGLGRVREAHHFEEVHHGF